MSVTYIFSLIFSYFLKSREQFDALRVFGYMSKINPIELHDEPWHIWQSTYKCSRGVYMVI